MINSNKTLTNLGTTLFMIGFVISFSLLLISVWADFEAAVFDPSLSSDNTLTSLKCPLILGKDERYGVVSITLENPTDKIKERLIRVHTTQGFVTLIREERTRVPIDPGETIEVEWEVNPDDAAYGYFILVKIYMFRSYPLPSEQGSCGIYVRETGGLTGNQLTTYAISISLISVILGLLLWNRFNQPLAGRVRHIYFGMIFLIGFIVIGLVFAMNNIWIYGLSSLMISVLFAGGFIVYLSRVEN